ncbi:MAG: ferrochelatase [Chlamydiia bacterium]|nr:ferrochelatase [Chlamydiia bacterium]
MQPHSPLLLINFGGPRHLTEIEPFLVELLTDRDVIRTPFPVWLHNLIFKRTARKRARAIQHDYVRIGGYSPIFSDTESLGAILSKRLQRKVITFHRYLPATHAFSLQQIERCMGPDIQVFPLFPQFCYATTGSIARFFQEHLSSKSCGLLRWIASYAAHPAFIQAHYKTLKRFLDFHQLSESDTVLLFSAHGVPRLFIDTGDNYESECIQTFTACMHYFPTALGRLCYQSKFGKGEWLRPSTEEASQDILQWHERRKNVVFVPITFTSDHIETLFEIESQYVPLIKAKHLNAYRCPALNLSPHWIEAIGQILQKTNFHSTTSLIR